MLCVKTEMNTLLDVCIALLRSSARKPSHNRRNLHTARFHSWCSSARTTAGAIAERWPRPLLPCAVRVIPHEAELGLHTLQRAFKKAVLVILFPIHGTHIRPSVD
jgi:hypothetical protein